MTDSEQLETKNGRWLERRHLENLDGGVHHTVLANGLLVGRGAAGDAAIPLGPLRVASSA